MNRRRKQDQSGGKCPFGHDAPKDDLLGRLLSIRKQTDKGKPTMSERQLIDECVTLFLAGHETTASAITFSLWLLAHNPDCQTVLREELDDVLGDRTEPTAADLDSLGYTRMVVAEALRLFPPIWAQGRRAHSDCVINGTPVKRGTEMIFMQYVTHRDPRWWPEPDKFDPLRFSPERASTRPRWAYFPFGGGRRACVGEAFAWSESVLALATILRRWWVEPANDDTLVLDPGVSLRPKNTVRVVFRS